MTHSPEPWQTAGNDEVITDANGYTVPMFFDNRRRIVSAVNAFAGIDLSDFEGRTLAEYVASKTMLTGMGPDAKGGFGIQLEGGACGLLAQAFAEQFKGSGAVNFLEVNFTHKELGDMSVTMQRTSGKTPGQLKAEAVAQRDELLAMLYTCLPFIEDAEKDPAYKTGVVGKLIAQIQALIAKTEENV